MPDETTSLVEQLRVLVGLAQQHQLYEAAEYLRKRFLLEEPAPTPGGSRLHG
jgi:hypothetical protein